MLASALSRSAAWPLPFLPPFTGELPVDDEPLVDVDRARVGDARRVNAGGV